MKKRTCVILVIAALIIGANVGVRAMTPAHLWNEWDDGALMKLSEQMKRDASPRLGLVILTRDNVYTLKNYLEEGYELQARYVSTGALESLDDKTEPTP